MIKRRNKTRRLQVNSHYYFKGQEVVIVNFGIIETEDEPIDTVGYKIINGDQLIHNVSRSEFKRDLIPTKLATDDVVYSVCMGKILCTYKVCAVDYLQSKAELLGDKTAFDVNIATNGKVTPIYGDVGKKHIEFYYLTNRKASELACTKRINDCISVLNDIRQQFIDTNLSSTTYKELTELYEKCMDLRVETTKVLKK